LRRAGCGLDLPHLVDDTDADLTDLVVVDRLSEYQERPPGANERPGQSVDR
jgi:hypothetical protein